MDELRSTLTASVCGKAGPYETGNASHCYTDYEQTTAKISSGQYVLTVTAKEHNNTGYYDDTYYEVKGYWVEDNVFYTLRVFGNAEDRWHIERTFKSILLGL